MAKKKGDLDFVGVVEQAESEPLFVEVETPVVSAKAVVVGAAPVPEVKGVDPFVPEPKTAKLTDEQKKHLLFLFEWVNTFSRRSANVEFRRGTKAAISELSKLL